MSVADPSLELQRAIVALLKIDPAVVALTAGQIYDDVPLSAVMPYVSLGPFDLLPEVGDCLDGAEVVIQLDAWAVEPRASVQVKQVGAAVAAALDEAELILDPPQRLVEMTLERIQYLRDPDGITAHGVITIRALCEPI